jgi:hypothetical protein
MHSLVSCSTSDGKTGIAAKRDSMTSQFGVCHLHFVNSFCNGNAKVASREYQRLYPDRGQPFATVQGSLRETGAFTVAEYTGHGRCNVQNEEEVSNMTRVNSSNATRQVAYETGLSESSLWRTCHEDTFHSGSCTGPIVRR